MKILSQGERLRKSQESHESSAWSGEKWIDRKIVAEKIAVKLSHLVNKDKAYKGRAERMAGCGHHIQTMSCPDGHHHRVVRAVLCKDRLCPICGWRRAGALAARTRVIMQTIGGRYLLLTLTVPNPQDGELAKTCRELTQAYGRLMRLPRLRGVIGGSIRTLEVTRKNKTWHPHIHALLRVEESYFRSALYIDQEEWLNLWKVAMRRTDITQVDIRPADISGATEVAKYVTKTAELNRYTLDQLHELAQAIKGLRLWSASGCLKISEEDIEAELLEHAGAEHQSTCPECGAVLQKVDHTWMGQGYKVAPYPVNWPQTNAEMDRARREGRRRRSQIQITYHGSHGTASL
jgi:Plasmid rolling circle replication initiator protein and truncated derivatives